MTPGFALFLAHAGFLRQALLGLALANALLPIVHALSGSSPADGRSLWDVFATLIAPAMAPLLAVVILFDYIMSRVRAADAEGAERERYAAIARIELLAMLVTLVFWVPYFLPLLT